MVVELGGVPVPLTPAERQPSLQFVAGGRVSGSDGCNRIRAPYTLAGATITFGAADRRRAWPVRAPRA